MIDEKHNWFKIVRQMRGSVVPRILPQIALCGGFGVLVSALEWWQFNVSWPIVASLLPNVVLGLLLVFRTNTAYDRFWEGRKLWGNMVIGVRNLARQILVAVEEEVPIDRAGKVRALRLLVAFSVATKQLLRGQPLGDDLRDLVSEREFELLSAVNSPPLEIGLWLGTYLQDQYEAGRINAYQLAAMHRHLDSLVDAFSCCERILRTPVPMAYAIHLKQLLLLYSLSLPFQVVGSLHWWTGPAVALFSFTLFGIEAIGIEIENPFGCDPNDLPLDDICATMRRNIDDLIRTPIERLRFEESTNLSELAAEAPPPPPRRMGA